MKKFLFWILTFLWIWLNFCSAKYCSSSTFFITYPSWITPCSSLFSSWVIYLTYSSNSDISFYDSWGNLYKTYTPNYLYIYSDWDYIVNNWNSMSIWIRSFSCPLSDFISLSPTICEDKDITVYYNNWNSSESITCDWVQAIEIQGLSTITSTNTFTPYFNIDYKDEDNQSLVESYSKDILYLSGSTFKKTYTWNNERILTSQWNSESIFTWYLPTFDITWWINEVTESWNIFNNFAENSVKFTLANIPSYIQYFIILLLLFLILWFVKKFKRK